MLSKLRKRSSALPINRPIFNLTLPSQEHIELLQSNDKPIKQHNKFSATMIIHDDLYLGDYSDASDTNGLQKLNIKHVVNMAKECSIVHPDTSGINVQNYGIVDHSDENNIKAAALMASQYIYECINKKKEKVIVNCRAGVSRSATVVVTYLMQFEGMPYSKAFMFVKEQRPFISPNLGFIRFLHKFNTKLYPNDNESDTDMEQTPTSLCTFMMIEYKNF